MQKQTKLTQPLLIAGCAGMIFASTGCRSAMPKWNLLSWRSTPSAETLAGNGPSITYPAPPGESATPDAIASYAGGTAERPENYAVAAASANSDLPVTGFDASAGSVSRAAAQANGFNLASNRTPSTATPSSTAATSLPGYSAASTQLPGNNSSIPAVPAGYKFGAKSSPSAADSGSRYSMPSSYPAPGTSSGGTSPANGYSLPTAAPSSAPSTFSPDSASMGQPPASSAGATMPSGGFAMPDSMLRTVNNAANIASNPKPFTPKLPTSVTNTATDSMTMTVPSAGLSLPGDPNPGVVNQTKPVGASTAGQTPATTVSTGATSPSFSTASASLSPRPYSGSSDSSTSGYAPGSTAGASSYPTTSGFPSTGTDGSFYR